MSHPAGAEVLRPRQHLSRGILEWLENLVIPETPIDLGMDHPSLELGAELMEAIEDHHLAVQTRAD